MTSKYDSEIVTEQNLTDLVKARDEQARIINNILELSRQLTSCNNEVAELVRYPHYMGDKDIEKIRKRLDSVYWYDFFNKQQIEKIITSSDKTKLWETIEENPVTFSEKSANAMYSKFVNSKEATARNMIKKVHKNITDSIFRLGNKHNANPQKRLQTGVKNKFRLSMFYTSYGGLPSYVSQSNSNFDIISDLERCLYLIDGDVQPDYNESITSITTKALQHDEQFVDSKYMTIKIFKNGNILVNIKDTKILDLFNKWGRQDNTLG